MAEIQSNSTGLGLKIKVDTIRQSDAAPLFETGTDLRLIYAFPGHTPSNTLEIYTDLAQKGRKKTEKSEP
jgi:site-specific recombinase XerD